MSTTNKINVKAILDQFDALEKKEEEQTSLSALCEEAAKRNGNKAAMARVILEAYPGYSINAIVHRINEYRNKLVSDNIQK